MQPYSNFDLTKHIKSSLKVVSAVKLCEFLIINPSFFVATLLKCGIKVNSESKVTPRSVI